MTEPRAKFTPQERLAKTLKQGSTIPELKEFRQQCRDVFKLGGVFGLDNFIEARRDLGLLYNKDVSKAADDLQVALGSVIDAATLNPEPTTSKLTAEERLRLINEREENARNSVRFVGTKVKLNQVSRMAAGFDKLLDEAIAMAQRDVP